MKNILISLLVSLSFSANSTTFVPLSIDRLVKQTDIIVEGQFVSKEYLVRDNGEVATGNYFKVSDQSGLTSDDIFDSEVVILTPGGESEGRVVQVDGSPEFQKGDHRLLFVKKSGEELWLAGLESGAFLVKKVGNSKLYQSSIFPYHPRAGQILKKDLKKMVYREKGLKFTKYVSSDEREKLQNARKVASTKKIKNSALSVKRDSLSRLKRSVASVNSTMVDDSSEQSPSIWWPIILLISLGSFARVVTRRKSH